MSERNLNNGKGSKKVLASTEKNQPVYIEKLFNKQIEEVTPPHWYVLKTKPRCEVTCSTLLRQNDITIYLPKLLSRSTRNRELKETPLFPGYLFFWLEDNSRYWPYMKWAFGVSYVLSGDDGPLYVPTKLVDALSKQETSQRRRLLKEEDRPIETGEVVEIVEGPFQGLEAIFEGRISAAGRCQVLIELLGRLAPIALSEKAVQRRAG